MKPHCEMKCEMRCETANIWALISGKGNFPNFRFLWAIALLAKLIGTGLCVIEVVPIVGYGNRHNL